MVNINNRINHNRIYINRFTELSVDIRRNIFRYVGLRDTLKVSKSDPRIRASIPQVIDTNDIPDCLEIAQIIYSTNVNQNDNKIRIIQNPEIPLASQDILKLIRKSNQPVRDVVMQYRERELNDYNLNNHITIHNDITNDNIGAKVNIIENRNIHIGNHKIRKLLRFESVNENLDFSIIDALETHRQPELNNLVLSNKSLTNDDIDVLVQIGERDVHLNLVQNINRPLTNENIFSIVQYEGNQREPADMPISRRILEVRQQEIINNPVIIAYILGEDFYNSEHGNVMTMPHILRSNLPIRQTILNGIFHGDVAGGVGHADDILVLMNSQRLDYQASIQPDARHDLRFNNGNFITNNMIIRYIVNLSDEQVALHDVPTTKALLVSAYNQMLIRRYERRERHDLNQHRNVRARTA